MKPHDGEVMACSFSYKMHPYPTNEACGAYRVQAHFYGNRQQPDVAAEHRLWHIAAEG